MHESKLKRFRFGQVSIEFESKIWSESDGLQICNVLLCKPRGLFSEFYCMSFKILSINELPHFPGNRHLGGEEKNLLF